MIQKQWLRLKMEFAWGDYMKIVIWWGRENENLEENFVLRVWFPTSSDHIFHLAPPQWNSHQIPHSTSYSNNSTLTKERTILGQSEHKTTATVATSWHKSSSTFQQLSGPAFLGKAGKKLEYPTFENLLQLCYKFHYQEKYPCQLSKIREYYLLLTKNKNTETVESNE